MNTFKLFSIAMTLSSLCSTTALAALLTDEPRRITDETIAADIKSIDAIQARLALVNAKKGVAIRNYHFAKSQAWIDFAREEYSINDRSVVVEEALKQANELIGKLEEGNRAITMATPVIATSRIVRPDMWELAEKLKKHQGFHCGEDKVAQFEVQLVWSGHEEEEMGWRHSKPYLQAAERLAKEAERLIYGCIEREEALARLPLCADPLSRPDVPSACTTEGVSGSPAVSAIIPDAAVTAAAAPEEPVVVGSQLLSPLPDRVHFALDRSRISDRSARVLDRVVKGMKDQPNLKIELRGHTDERADDRYNLKLSERRAENVREYLINAGIAPERITMKWFGKLAPLSVQRNPEGFARNRRVELFFTSCDGPPLEGQSEDLQPEKLRKR